MSILAPSLLPCGLSPWTFQKELLVQVRHQLLDLARKQKLAEPFQVQRTDLLDGMFSIKMLHDEKEVQRQHQLFLTQPARIPEHHQLILSLLNGRELQISQDRILRRILDHARRHSADILGEEPDRLQLGTKGKVTHRVV